MRFAAQAVSNTHCMCGAVLSEVSGVSACVAAVQYDHTAAASAAHSKHVCPESSSRAHEDMCHANCS